MTEISDLFNNMDLKENAYQATLQQHIEFLPTINKITDLSIPRRQTTDHGYKKKKQAETYQQCFKLEEWKIFSLKTFVLLSNSQYINYI